MRQSLQQRESVAQGVTQLIQIKQLPHVKRASNDRKQILDQLPTLIKKRQEEQVQYLQALEQSDPTDADLKELFKRFLENEPGSFDKERTAEGSLEGVVGSHRKRGGTIDCTAKGLRVSLD